MRRIVNRSLLDIYKNADHKYKSSQDFESVLKKTMINLDKDPNHKFSHIKHLCDLLRHGRVKKRAKLITLDKNVKSRFLFLYLHFRHEIVRPNLEARFCKSYQYLMVLNKILEYLWAIHWEDIYSLVFFWSSLLHNHHLKVHQALKLEQSVITSRDVWNKEIILLY